MDVEQARILITALGGRSARTDWLGSLGIPPGVSVDVADFGYRVTIILVNGGDTVTLVADLGTGDAALSANVGDESPLVQFARRILAARMAMEIADPAPASKEPKTHLRGLVDASGARWISTELDGGRGEDISSSDQSPRTELDE